MTRSWENIANKKLASAPPGMVFFFTLPHTLPFPKKSLSPNSPLFGTSYSPHTLPYQGRVINFQKMGKNHWNFCVQNQLLFSCLKVFSRIFWHSFNRWRFWRVIMLYSNGRNLDGDVSFSCKVSERVEIWCLFTILIWGLNYQISHFIFFLTFLFLFRDWLSHARALVRAFHFSLDLVNAAHSFLDIDRAAYFSLEVLMA